MSTVASTSSAPPLASGLRALVTHPLGDPPWGDTLEGTTAFLDRWSERRPVTVVVPIFNGAEHVARCLSGLGTTVPPDCEIILVDDHSTDPAVAGLCQAFATAGPTTRVITNPQNVGYVLSVNAGIRSAQPDNDVVLLNSDTVTPPGWLRKLQLAAAARPRIASVSPLSNAAGVFSVPTAYEDGSLPDGLTVEGADRLLSLASERRYEMVPVSCGFCMYLKRDALAEVGLFDDRIFHRGYGEENDWCERAREGGFVHVVDESGFVAHYHGASFGSEKARLKRRNGSLVKALYPRHVDDTSQWLARSRLEEVRATFRDLWAVHKQSVGALPLARSDVRLVLESRDGATRATSDTVVLRLNQGRCELDLFGVGRSTHELSAPAELTRLVAQLVVRWDVSKLEVRSPELQAHLDPRVASSLLAASA